MIDSNTNIGSKSKIHIHWKVSPYDFSRDTEKDIISQASKKYGIPKDRIKLIPEFVVLNKKGESISIAHEVIQNIQKPEFQQKLFKSYIIRNNIQDFNFDIIKSIDDEINARINYEVYDKYRRYKIKWIRWKNFLSYGSDNFFDFTNLNGLTLLNGEPANQSGKTTFAIDLTHFLFFGKVEKYPTQDKIFNKHLDEATEVVVEGCIEIEGNDYIIKRRLSRPALSRRTAKSKTIQKVEYYKLVNGELSELEEYVDNQQEENSVQTNKIIKEAIGNESDFDMIVCATSKNLDDLIEKKETERGRLLSRWIGLLPIEQKEQLAKEKFNNEVKPYLVTNRYKEETIAEEVVELRATISALKKEIETNQKNAETTEKEIAELEETQRNLLSMKSTIDESLLKIDIHTLNKKIETIVESGKNKKEELKVINGQLAELEKVQFSMEEYNCLLEVKSVLINQLAEVKANCVGMQKTIKDLHSSEYCPTCGRKYDNIDNTAKIKELTDELNAKIQQGSSLKSRVDETDAQIANMRVAQEQYVRKCKIQAQKGAVEVSIEQSRNAYIESKHLLDEYNKNNEAINRNNQLAIQINNNVAALRSKRLAKETLNNQIVKSQKDIENYQKGVEERLEIVRAIDKERILLRNWKIYLDMVGKNGISKMLLRQVIPVINAQISALLNEICDFTVEMDITDKNDVVFYLVKDNVRSDLSGGSGFERTAAALALRAVLGNISTLPRMSGLVLDEIWGRVAKENYENLHKLLEEISKSFDFILLISHLDEVKDFCNTIITVTKTDNISSLKQTTK